MAAALAVLWLVTLVAGLAVVWRRAHADTRAVEEHAARLEPWWPAEAVEPVTPAQLRALWEGAPPPPARFDGEGAVVK